MTLDMVSSVWFDDFVGLFTNNYNLVCMICLAIGLVLLAVECFIPGFGIFGITGIVFCLFSIVFMIVMGGTVRQVLYVISLVLIVAVVVVLIAIRSARFGAISKSSLVQKRTALPTDYDSNEKNYLFLVGKEGKTETICKPVGKITINGQTYSALTSGEYIEKDVEIVVTEVDGTTIYIKER